MATEDDVNQNKPYLTKKAQNLKMKSLKMQTAEMTIRPVFFISYNLASNFVIRC